MLCEEDLRELRNIQKKKKSNGQTIQMLKHFFTSFESVKNTYALQFFL